MTDELALKAAMRRVNTAARSRWHVACVGDWKLVLDAHPDKPELDATAAWYPMEATRQ